MNKPFFTAVACLLLSSTLAMGQMPFQFINLVKVPDIIVPIPTPHKWIIKYGIVFVAIIEKVATININIAN